MFEVDGENMERAYPVERDSLVLSTAASSSFLAAWRGRTLVDSRPTADDKRRRPDTSFRDGGVAAL